ncbi:MAG: hypothetical protein BWY43_00077 [candidate division WS2 bacterium ADurb.Bin280]|uniref:Uncharacterized protein n=1 Tax=candidate division WS2 bacterium ADurb.Bin280 TaxID=1852829 RepID=A0A1V5SFK5_9BACT|nr:MAG: hypothetical protein BWY43_00077 [candidate division WS2 bacterium ADurb.Bin280]
MSEQKTINQNIEVLARFSAGTLSPIAFKYEGRLIKIESIDLSYKTRSGSVLLLSFHVSSNANSYKITYDGTRLSWVLEESFF